MSAFCITFRSKEEDEGKLLREFLKEKQISKAALTEIKFSGGALFVNGTPVTVRYVLKAGDSITVQFPKEVPSEDLKAEAMLLDIVYEDDFILVVNKPSSQSSIPSREHRYGTLANGIMHYYQTKNYEATIHIVTRLDRDTSGLMLIAKHRHAHHLFSLQQRKYGIHRRYEAIVHGVMKRENGKIDAPIGRKETSIIEREVREDGQEAVTNYNVLGRYPEITHVSLRLETGRTHQIRVHMAYLGHPLVGDDLYGGKRWIINRQALHSCELSFYHPFLEKQFTFHSPLPDDMAALLGDGENKK